MRKSLFILIIIMAGVFAADLQTTLEHLDDDIADSVDTTMSNHIGNTANEMYQVNYKLLTMEGMKIEQSEEGDMAAMVQAIVSAMALVAIGFFGLQYMFQAKGAHERNKAKQNLMNMLVLLVIAISGAYIFDVVIGIENDMTVELASTVGGSNMGTADAFSVGEHTLNENPGPSLLYIIGLAVSGFSLTLRWLFLDMSRTLFPFFVGLAFMPIDILKGAGRILLKGMIIFVIIPFIDMIFIGSMATLVGMLSGGAQQIVIMALAFLMIGVLNLLLPYLALQFSTLSQVNFMSVVSQMKGRMG